MWCWRCSKQWPCDSAKLIDYLEEILALEPVDRAAHAEILVQYSRPPEDAPPPTLEDHQSPVSGRPIQWVDFVTASNLPVSVYDLSVT
jgi:hypothetical protein